MPHIAYIYTQKRADKRLKHASNIITKYNKRGNQALSQAKRTILLSIAEQYHTYLESNLDLHGYDDNTIIRRVALLNNYYDYIHNNGWDNAFDSRGKFRSTILEEFIYLLFKNYITDLRAGIQQDYRKNIDTGAIKAYLNLFITGADFNSFIVNPSMNINTKDQDYAIYRKIKIKLGEQNEKTINVPCVAIEAKTYIDKTMLDTIIATAEKLKGGNPYTKFIAVAETYDVDLKVDPAYSRIDQIYVLRKSHPGANPVPPIDSQLVCELFHEIKKHIESPWSDVSRKLPSGKIL